MDKFMATIKGKKVLGIVGALLLILGPILPCVSRGSHSYSYVYLEGEIADGIFVVILAAIALFMVFKAKKQIFVLIPTALAALLVFFEFSQMFEIADPAIGFFVMLLGMIALAIYPFVYKGEKTDIEV